MSTKANPTRIGLFVIGAVALAVVILVAFGSGTLFRDTDYYIAYFRGSTNGLHRGAPVRLLGVDVGTVKHVHVVFDESGEFVVEVLMEVDPSSVKSPSGLLDDATQEESYRFLMARDLRAQLEVQSLVLGVLYVKLDYFPGTEAVFEGIDPSYLEIPTVQTPGEEMMEKFTRVVEMVADIPVAELADRLLTTLEHIDSLVVAIDLEDVLSETAMTMREVRALSEELRGQVSPMAEQVTVTSETAGETMERIDALVTRLEEITVAESDDLHDALQELTAAARSMRLLAEYIQQNPSSLIFGKD